MEIDLIYDSLEGCEDLLRYKKRHGIPSLLILTQHIPEIAIESCRLLKPHIEGKRVIEIGAGVGFLAIEMAKVAKSVIAIECDPAWSWSFTKSLYSHKPANLTWIFGTADSVADSIRGEVAVIFTNSGIDEMREIGKRFAPVVLMALQNEIFARQKFVFDPIEKIMERHKELAAHLVGNF